MAVLGTIPHLRWPVGRRIGSFPISRHPASLVAPGQGTPSAICTHKPTRAHRGSIGGRVAPILDCTNQGKEPKPCGHHRSLHQPLLSRGHPGADSPLPAMVCNPHPGPALQQRGHRPTTTPPARGPGIQQRGEGLDRWGGSYGVLVAGARLQS